MGKDMILTTAGIEAMLTVAWRTHRWRVQEYIRTSTACHYADSNPSRSWCGDFAYWVLQNSGIWKMPPLAQLEQYADQSGKTHSGWNTVSRYINTYGTTTDPSPGDMYYMRFTTAHNKDIHKATDHVGFVVEPPDGTTLKSVDGNTGTDVSILVKGIGGGYVAYNDRQLSLVDCFIPIPD